MRASPHQRHVTPRGAGVPLVRTTGYTRRRSDASARTFYAHIRTAPDTRARRSRLVRRRSENGFRFGSSVNLKTKQKSAYKYKTITTIKSPVSTIGDRSRATKRVFKIERSIECYWSRKILDSDTTSVTPRRPDSSPVGPTPRVQFVHVPQPRPGKIEYTRQ